jgi:opacity protein-like surface antigen
MRNLVVAFALACMAGSASASPLDLAPIAAGPQYRDFNSKNTLLATSNEPIRRRRPWRDRDRDYDYGRYRESTMFAMLGAGGFDPTNQPGNGLYVNGAIGSTLADQIDFGVQLSWYHRSTDGEQFVREGDLPDGTHVTTVVNTQSIDTDLVPVMATLRVRIPVSPQLQPYVGGGIGWEWLTVDGTDENGFDFSNDYDGFGAQLYGGLNLNVSRGTGLYGEAVWNASTPKAEFFDPAIGQTVREEVDMDGLAIHGGLRLMF